MSFLLSVLLAATATAQNSSGGNALAGYRIHQVDHGSGVGVEHNAVVGPDGGTTLLGLTARYGADDYAFSVTVPVAAHRTPLGRDVNMGNLQLAGFYHLGEAGPMFQSIGLELHANIGDNAWTWVNDPDQLWPTYGGNLVWQGKMEIGPLMGVFRGHFGVHGTPGDFRPYPNVYARFGAAGLVDYSIVDRIGIVGEMSVSYWDTSPWEVTGLARFDPMDGLRVRAGIVLPFGVWAGMGPTQRPAGARETTLLLDASLAF